MIDEQTRTKLVDCAREYTGVRFVHAGRSMNGLDCVGLLLVAAWGAGLKIENTKSYSPIVNGERVQYELGLACSPIGGREPQPGDVILFNISGSPQHTAVITCIDDDTGLIYMIHAHQGIGKVIEQRLDKGWTDRIVDIYEWNGNPI